MGGLRRSPTTTERSGSSSSDDGNPAMTTTGRGQHHHHHHNTSSASSRNYHQHSNINHHRNGNGTKSSLDLYKMGRTMWFRTAVMFSMGLLSLFSLLTSSSFLFMGFTTTMTRRHDVPIDDDELVPIDFLAGHIPNVIVRRNGGILRRPRPLDEEHPIVAYSWMDDPNGRNQYAAIASLDHNDQHWKPRIVFLDDQGMSSHHARRHMEEPSMVENMTRYDEALAHDSIDQYILPYEEPFYSECVPMADWRHHPTCNLLHEVEAEVVVFLSARGSWRTAWSVVDKENITSVLKMLHLNRDFDIESFTNHQLDARVLERLSSSPFVINQYGFCGQSQLSEFAPHDARSLIKSKKLTPLDRLLLARDLALGLDHMHSLDYPRGTNSSFAYNDLNIANIMNVGTGEEGALTIKYNDFNIGEMMRWNTTSNRPCGFPVRFESPLWRSPEEVWNTTYVNEKVDVYSLGNVLFQVLTTHQPWTHLEPVRPSLEEVGERKKHGELPYFPDKFRYTPKLAVQALYFATASCFSFDPADRPTAYQLAMGFDQVLKWMDGTTPNLTAGMVRDLFIVEHANLDHIIPRSASSGDSSTSSSTTTGSASS